MKIKQEVIEKTLSHLVNTIGTNGNTVTLNEFVAGLHDDTGIELPAKAVREALEALPDVCTVTKVGSNVSVTYYAPEKRKAWKRADELAAVLGGTAVRYVDDRVVQICLDLTGAEALAALVSLAKTAVKKS